MATNQIQSCILSDETRLGVLAMNFRGTKDDTERQAIAGEYSQAVTKLIQSGAWTEMPPLEDQLPDDFMPKEFFEDWGKVP